MSAADTADHILNASVKLAEKVGWDNLTREAIATAAGVSPALVTFRLGQKPELMRNVMRRAIKLQSLPVVAQGLARNDKTARKAPDELKAAAAAYVAAR
jgi:AcrR family transcriptional regulator